jgi:pyruvate/2-oxoglutarate dehydrogenase complex dihydrolipoamide dehydrogenase (E3) component
MQAAIIAAERGHDVTLYEKSDSLGGLLKISHNNPVKMLINKYMNFLITQTHKHDIDVRLNMEATPELVQKHAADAVIVATGSNPLIPNIPGVDRKNVFNCVEAHASESELGDRIVIIGGNLVGCETAMYLSQLGKKATIVEMTGQLHADANNALAVSLDYHLSADVRFLVNAKCTEISENGVHIEFNDGNTDVLPADSVILAVGMKPTTETVDSMLDCAIDVIPVGDCIRPGTVREASRTGYYAALDI